MYVVALAVAFFPDERQRSRSQMCFTTLDSAQTVHTSARPKRTTTAAAAAAAATTTTTTLV